MPHFPLVPIQRCTNQSHPSHCRARSLLGWSKGLWWTSNPLVYRFRARSLPALSKGVWWTRNPSVHRCRARSLPALPKGLWLTCNPPGCHYRAHSLLELSKGLWWTSNQSGCHYQARSLPALSKGMRLLCAKEPVLGSVCPTKQRCPLAVQTSGTNPFLIRSTELHNAAFFQLKAYSGGSE